jgi:hypothetical protein
MQAAAGDEHQRVLGFANGKRGSQQMHAPMGSLELLPFGIGPVCTTAHTGRQSGIFPGAGRAAAAAARLPCLRVNNSAISHQPLTQMQRMRWDGKMSRRFGNIISERSA